jgi:hypothetical protein
MIKLKNMSFKKEKKQIKLDDSTKPELIFQIHNPLNPRFGVNQGAQFKME